MERAIVQKKRRFNFYATRRKWNMKQFKNILQHNLYDTILSYPTYSNEDTTMGTLQISAENPRKKYDSSEYTTSTAASLFPATNVKAAFVKAQILFVLLGLKTKNATSYSLYRSESLMEQLQV